MISKCSSKIRCKPCRPRENTESETTETDIETTRADTETDETDQRITELNKENEKCDKIIRDFYFPSTSAEAFIRLAMVKREKDRTMRMIREISLNDTTTELISDLNNLTIEYLSYVEIENLLYQYCYTLLEQEKEKMNIRRETMKKMTSKKFNQEISNYFTKEIRYENKPYSKTCGNNFRPNIDFEMGSFACFNRKKNDYILVMIAYPIEKNTWIVYDAEPSSNISKYRAKPNMLFPMTTSLPLELRTDLEVKEGDHVLSLWREDEDSEWTTQFYGGEIIEVPEERGKGYKIRYDEDQSELVVPERFIISLDVF